MAIVCNLAHRLFTDKDNRLWDTRKFQTVSGKAHFTGNELEYLRVPPGRLILQTLRPHAP